jgi:hypothetical protein
MLLLNIKRKEKKVKFLKEENSHYSIEKLPDITNVFIMTDDEYFIGNISTLVPSNKYFLLDIPRSEIKPIVGGYGQVIR